MTDASAERLQLVEGVRAMLSASAVGDVSIPDLRAQMDSMTALVPVPAGVTVTSCELGGRPAECIVPDGLAADRGVLYLHGGAYVIGSLDSHRTLAARLALAAGMAVWTLDYRLAPEHPFPAAVDDATAAFADLVAGGVAAASLAVAGDSAGGGLTVATLVALRDSGSPLPAAAVALSPWADLTCRGDSYRNGGTLDPMITRDNLVAMAAHYLAGADATEPLASPCFADLSGLPPLWIDVGGAEALLDDATALAAAAEAAGVDVTLEVWPDLFHVFQAFPPEMVPDSAESVARIGRFLAERVGGAVAADAG